MAVWMLLAVKELVKTNRSCQAVPIGPSIGTIGPLLATYWPLLAYRRRNWIFSSRPCATSGHPTRRARCVPTADLPNDGSRSECARQNQCGADVRLSAGESSWV